VARRHDRVEPHVVTSVGARETRPVLLVARDRVDVPWRNGGGTTTVVAAFSAEAGVEPGWRVSIATISRAGAFSVFPGVDRVLVPLSPAGLTLEVAGRIRHVAQHEAISFAGEEAVAAVDVDAPGDDLNLMTKRGVYEGSIGLRGVVGGAEISAGSGETVVLVVLDGRLDWGEHLLGPRDALILPPGASVALDGTAEVAAASMRTARVKA
jgi:environmental stress-induced protein Ves